MKIKAYALKDILVEAFNAPFYAPNDRVAQRVCSDVASDPETLIGKHPEDFDLYLLGEFDDHSGEFTNSLKFIGRLVPAPTPTSTEGQENV